MYHFYPYYPVQQQQQQFFPWYNQPYIPHTTTSFDTFGNPSYSHPLTDLNSSHYPVINKNFKTFSDFELANLLNDQRNILKQLHDRDQQQQLPILNEFLTTLLHIPRSKLLLAIPSDVSSLIRTTFNAILQEWRYFSYLPNNKALMFRTSTKLIRRLIKVADDIKLIPLWISDSTLLDTIATCLTDIATTGKFLDHNNKYHFKHFTHLIETYTLYQQYLNQHNHFNKDTFIQLLHPIQQCLTSNHFINTFTNLSTTSNSLTTVQKFLLLKSPAFLTSYNGPALEETMHQLLSTMLPHYVTILGQAMKSCAHWSQSMIRCVESILATINHGTHEFPNNVKMMSDHLALIDHVLKLLDEPILYNNVNETLAMPESDKLLDAIIQSLKATIHEKSEKKHETEQLLETLKGLIQHDHIKTEISKENVLPFLLELTDKLTGKAYVLLLEILWSLTFHDESAVLLRSNASFLKRIETISKESRDEALKKAADGLVWKLIREPEFLDKIAKQEENEEHTDVDVTQTIVEEIVNDAGQKQLVTTIKPATHPSGERIFQFDIMISYCHADKELTHKIHKFLVKQGFKIWIDLDNMNGPAMSAMADAVENSEFVIMCMSDSYKQSTYCQAEAEYAFNCKRRLIPLIMRAKYRPDGWLGFLIGSRIYVDFGRFDFDTACRKLMTEISLQSKRPLPSKLNGINQHEKPDAATSSKKSTSTIRQEKSSMNDNNNLLSEFTKRKVTFNFKRKLISQWTDSDVLDYLFTEHLIQMMPLCIEMNGRAFIQLYKMCISKPSRMYTILNEELKSTYKTKLPIGVFSRFLSAVEQRSNMNPWALPETSLQYSETAVTNNIPEDILSNIYSTPVINYDPVQYSTYSDKPYDLVITSNASALDVLRAIERYGLNFAKTIFP
ncbi:hypothetical protein I4U23_008938 [Adineta vaga]|nr:hypothetical protein I4U23_008938 [Adineta vaga]